jgi:uncharacterized membrane protein
MDERLLMIVLRIVHILGGIFWVGGLQIMAWFAVPAQRATGESGGVFIRQMMLGQKLSTWFSASAGLTLLSGLLLYWRLIDTSSGAWARTRPAMIFGLGAAAALLAMIIGGVMGGGSARKMGPLGARIAASQGNPDPALLQEMRTLQARSVTGVRIAASLTMVAAAAMAVARYTG